MQAGRIGEYLLAVYAVQAKACFELGESGFVQSNATYSERSIPTDPSWIYVIVLELDLAPVVWWVIQAPDFNRITSHSPARGGREVELHFRAHPDGGAVSIGDQGPRAAPRGLDRRVAAFDQAASGRSPGDVEAVSLNNRAENGLNWRRNRPKQHD